MRGSVPNTSTPQWKLLLISAGNISNRDLEALFLANLSAIAHGFGSYDYIEITRTNIVFHT
jgi:predicted nuclease of predicted toxin-antitoxin system